MKTLLYIPLILLFSGCYGVTIQRSHDNATIHAQRPYTAIYAPDGTVFIDTQGNNKSLLLWFDKMLEKAVERSGDSIRWNIGEKDDKTDVIINGS